MIKAKELKKGCLVSGVSRDKRWWGVCLQRELKSGNRILVTKDTEKHPDYVLLGAVVDFSLDEIDQVLPPTRASRALARSRRVKK
jgi:hypothetical protein